MMFFESAISLTHQLDTIVVIGTSWYTILKIFKLWKNIGRKISDIPCSNIFTNVAPRAREIKEKINKLDYIKIKCSCTTKETIAKMTRELSVWENIVVNDILDTGLISQVYKELIRLNTRKTNNAFKKWAKDLNRHFSNKDIQRAQRHIWKDAQRH